MTRPRAIGTVDHAVVGGVFTRAQTAFAHVVTRGRRALVASRANSTTGRRVTQGRRCYRGGRRARGVVATLHLAALTTSDLQNKPLSKHALMVETHRKIPCVVHSVDWTSPASDSTPSSARASSCFPM